MTAHQRRPGFRLPWSSEGDAGDPTSAAHDPATSPAGAPATASDEPMSDDRTTAAVADATDAAEVTETTPEMHDQKAAEAGADAEQPPTEPEAPSRWEPPAAPEATHTAGQPAGGLMGDLLAAMRKVADDARESTLAELRSRAEDVIRDREGGVERRREELRAVAETDIAGVGEWAKAEAERIRAEAERRVAARREELERQIAAEGTRHESSAASVRERVAAYERRLQTFHEQLSAVSDPAEFAAAAKRMPPPPDLEAPDAIYAQPVVPDPEPAAPAVEPAATSANGTEPASPVAEASGDGSRPRLDAVEASAPSSTSETVSEPMATEIVVKGLGSFGAITGFRQQLAAVEGVDAVGLSLGASGEFVFRATHRPSLDMAAAITSMEGESVEIEPRTEGGLRVTLGRPR